MYKGSASQTVMVRNRYAVAEYETLEAAAESLSQIGVMTKDEIMKLLSDRVGYINGFVVTYPEEKQ